MSPRGFRWYAALWLGCCAVVLAVALLLTAEPWRGRGHAPAYALALLGAPEAPAPGAGCRTELLDAQGRRSVAVQPGPCGQAATSAGAAQPDPTRLRLAAALHGALVLTGAAALCLALRHLLRRPFLRPVGGGWVRRGG